MLSAHFSERNSRSCVSMVRLTRRIFVLDRDFNRGVWWIAVVVVVLEMREAGGRAIRSTLIRHFLKLAVSRGGSVFTIGKEQKTMESE